LSRAAEKGNKAVVELLLKNGAQPDFEDENNCTPLSRGIEGGNASVVELLLAQGVKVDYRYSFVSKFNRSTLIDWLTLSSLTIAECK
jgi:ankyrin repeat protein